MEKRLNIGHIIRGNFSQTISKGKGFAILQ